MIIYYSAWKRNTHFRNGLKRFLIQDQNLNSSGEKPTNHHEPNLSSKLLAAQSMIHGPSAYTKPGSWLEMQYLRPHPDLLNQNLHFNKSPVTYMHTKM